MHITLLFPTVIDSDTISLRRLILCCVLYSGAVSGRLLFCLSRSVCDTHVDGIGGVPEILGLIQIISFHGSSLQLFAHFVRRFAFPVRCRCFAFLPLAARPHSCPIFLYNPLFAGWFSSEVFCLFWVHFYGKALSFVPSWSCFSYVSVIHARVLGWCGKQSCICFCGPGSIVTRISLCS